MRITDHRYEGELTRFNLAVRMVGHEARTGTIRACTGFSEDRIRKIYGTYFQHSSEMTVRRRRGKSPSQIATFLKTSSSQSEATVLACLFMYCGLMRPGEKDGVMDASGLDPVRKGERLCDAYESYVAIHPEPSLCFEKAWSLYKSLVVERELFFARCNSCEGPYIQDRYALDYAHCPFCEIKHTS